VPESESPLTPLLDTERDLRREFRRRNSIWELKSVSHADEPAHVEQGWTVHRKLKTTVKLQKERPLDERLENKWWVLLYKMGYHEMNEGRQFRVLLKRREGVEGKKQIDVYARDEETVIVAECKACEQLRTRSLQKDIEELGALKGDISSAIKKFYGAEFKPKILWFFVTENIIWSEEDISRAKTHNIKRVTENELPYYTQLIEHLGRAARFQFLAEFLKDQPIPGLENIKVPATRGKLGGKYFYSFVTTPRHLLKIAFVNHRTLDDPEGHPTYQRLIQKGRLRDIGSFIEAGGYFPNNLLVNFMKPPRFDILEKDITTDVHYGQLYLPNTYKSAWIIDGQHRLYGYANIDDKHMDEKLIVVAFEGMKKEEEADLFVTINHEQRSVPKNLLDDLEGQLKWGSEDPAERVGALSARILHQLNRDLSSPFYNRFTAEGLKSTNKACLTIPQVKSAIRRSRLVGFAATKDSYERGVLCGATDNATLLRAQKVFNGYFRAIYNADVARWDSGREGRICNNEGIQAFTLLLGEIAEYLYKGDVSKFIARKEQQLLADFMPLVEPILTFIKGGGATVDAYFTVPFGSGGPKEYLFRLTKLIRPHYPDFGPTEFVDWETAQRDDLKAQADEQVKKINKLVLKHIFTIFRKMYGEQNNAYWEKGITNAKMAAEAYGRRVQDAPEERGPYENYLDFIDLKKIVEKERWKLFKSVLDIPLPGAPKGQAKNLDWMDRINELRRISAHPSDSRNYKSEDFPLIDLVCTTLEARVSEFNYDTITAGEAGTGG
jgi:DGQHR domain-containing protein